MFFTRSLFLLLFLYCSAHLYAQHLQIQQTYKGDVTVIANVMDITFPDAWLNSGVKKHAADSVWIYKIWNGNLLDSTKACVQDITSFQALSSPYQMGFGSMLSKDRDQNLQVRSETDGYTYRACRDYRLGCASGRYVFNTACNEYRLSIRDGKVQSVLCYEALASDRGQDVPRHFTKRVAYEYDRKGNLSAKKEYLGPDSILTTVMTYVYDDKNRIERFSSVYLMDAQVVPRHNQSFFIHYFYKGDKIIYKVYSNYNSPQPGRKTLDSLCMLFDDATEANSDLQKAEAAKDMSDKRHEKIEDRSYAAEDQFYRFVSHWPLQYHNAENLVHYRYKNNHLTMVRTGGYGESLDDFFEPQDSMTYDRDGRVLIHISGVWRTIYEYDAKTGKLLHLARMNKQSQKVVDQEWYEYDEKGRIKLIRSQEGDGTDMLSFRLKYDF